MEWSEKDKEFMRMTENYRYDLAKEPIYQEVRRDHLEGVWKPLQANPKFEKTQKVDGDSPTPGGPVLREKMLGERGHGSRVRPQSSSRMSS